MTAEYFQTHIVRPLSNSCYVRHWLCWRNDHTERVWLAVQCVELMEGGRYKVIKCNDLLGLGFEEMYNDGPMYIILRTNEDGTPFETQLF